MLLLGDYYLNPQSYLAQCENRDKPKMDCNGKCQLAKKIQQDTQEEPGHKKDHRFELLWTIPSTDWAYIELDSTSTTRYPPMRTPDLREAHLSLFKQPTA